MAAHSSDFLRYLAAITHKYASSKPGLWANIRAKRERGGKPAKPGDKDYPDSKSWKKVTNISSKKQAASDIPADREHFSTLPDGTKIYRQNMRREPDEDGIHDRLVADFVDERGNKVDDPFPDDSTLHKDILKKFGGSSPAWQRAAGKNEEGGLNAKGRASYNKATGGNLKAPVTESNPKGDRAKRQNSFCARMCGMKRVNTGGKTKKDPDSRINKSLRKWNCKCGSDEEKQAMIPGVIGGFAGAAGGALTGKKDKVNRAIGRGALIGAATELGMTPGMALGMIPGAMIGNAIAGPEGAKTGLVLGGGLGMGAGGMLGNAAAQGLLGPYETEEELAQELEQEKKEEKKMAAFEFGRKIAANNNRLHPLEMAPNAGPPKPLPRPDSVVMPGNRPPVNLDNFFEQNDYEIARAKARPDSSARTGPALAAQSKFKQTWNPIHLGSAVGKTVNALGSNAGEALQNVYQNNPQELAFQNTQYDIAESEKARAYRAQQKALAQQPQTPGFFARMLGAKPEPNIFEELERPVRIDGGEVPIGAVSGPRVNETNFHSNQDIAAGKHIKGGSAFDFGRKVATVTMCSAPKHNDQSGVDVNPAAAGTPEGKEKLTKKKAPVKAEDVVTSKAALFGRKLAQSLVNFVERKPKDLTKGTLNPHAAGEQEEDTAEPENEEDDGLIV